MQAVHAFQQRLWEHKLLCTIRETRGDDERSACGQLATKAGQSKVLVVPTGQGRMKRASRHES